MAGAGALVGPMTDGGDGEGGGGGCRRQPPASANAAAATAFANPDLISGVRRNITFMELYWGLLK
jgi:hypothetical protein